MLNFIGIAPTFMVYMNNSGLNVYSIFFGKLAVASQFVFFELVILPDLMK